MKYAEEKPRLHKLLSSAITLLCKNGLGLVDLPFSVEGLIGISVNEEDVMYLSFKETVTPDEELSVLVQQQDSNCKNEVESGGSCTWDDVDYILNHDDQREEESFNMPSLENVCVKPVEPPKLSQKPQARKKPRRRKKTSCQVQSVKLEKVSETKDGSRENSCLNKSFTSGVIKTEVNESGDNFGSLGVGGKLSRRKAYIPTRCPETDAPFDQSFDGTVKSEWNDVDFKVVGTLEIQSDLTSSVPQAVYTSSQYSSNSGASQKKSRKRARQSNKYSPQKSQVHKSACGEDHDAAISQLFPFLPDQHRPVVIPPTVTQFAPKKRCRICYSKKVRKEVRYCCFGCEDRPGLCLDPCFYEYHHLRGKILSKEEQDGTGSDEYLSPNDFKATDDNYQSVDIPKQESMCSETEENLTANHVVTEEYGNSHFPPDIKTSQLHQEAQSFISEDNLNGWPRSPDFEDPVSRASHVQFLDNS